MPFQPVIIKTEDTPMPCENAFVTRTSKHGVKIGVHMICRGRASRLCDDFLLALEHGAVPHVQALMIEEVTQADKNKIPLACMLSFGS